MPGAPSDIKSHEREEIRARIYIYKSYNNAECIYLAMKGLRQDIIIFFSL